MKALGAALCLTLFFSNISLADENNVEIPVRANFEPRSAIVYVMSAEHSTEIADPKISKSPDGEIIVSFPFSATNVPENVAYATAMISGELQHVAEGTETEEEDVEPAGVRGLHGGHCGEIGGEGAARYVGFEVAVDGDAKCFVLTGSTDEGVEDERAGGTQPGDENIVQSVTGVADFEGEFRRIRGPRHPGFEVLRGDRVGPVIAAAAEEGGEDQEGVDGEGL